jgi:ribosome-associated protein
MGGNVTRFSAMDDAYLEVTPTLRIPRAELEYRATRAGGPGGQHVNTSSTRIELVWDVVHSAAPSDEQRALLLERLASRLDGDGKLRLVAVGSRSQLRNREEATDRLRRVLADALRVRRSRRVTRVPKAVKLRRVAEKRRRGEVKRNRGPIRGDD